MNSKKPRYEGWKRRMEEKPRKENKLSMFRRLQKGSTGNSLESGPQKNEKKKKEGFGMK